MEAYDIRGYRVVGLAYEGAYNPKPESDGRLVLNEAGVIALKSCVSEDIKCRLGFLYGKWVNRPDGMEFNPGYIAANLKDQNIIPSPERLDRMRAVVARAKRKLRDDMRVNAVFIEFLEQKDSGKAAA